MSLIQLIKQASMEAVSNSSPFELTFGTIINTSPLTVQINQMLTLKEGDGILFKTKNVFEYDAELEFTDENIKQICTSFNMEETTESDEYKLSFKVPVKHKVKIYNKLNVNDVVLLLKQQGGQRYFILDKLEVI